MVGMVAPWPLAGSALLSLLLPVMLCLAGSVTYHTLMANHWNYNLYITIDVGHVVNACCPACLHVPVAGLHTCWLKWLGNNWLAMAADVLSCPLGNMSSV